MNRSLHLRQIALAVLIIAFLLSPGSWAQDSLTDPYKIYAKHFEAIGGLDIVKAESTSYTEADISMAGMTGIIKNWNKTPIYERQEIDLKMFQQNSGDNGLVEWSLDTNGKVLIQKDKNALLRRDINKLLAQYDYLDPNSAIFDLTYAGIEKVGDYDCYVIKMTNTINNDIIVTYFDTTSYLVIKKQEIQPDIESHTLYSDYRDIGGVSKSFHQEITDLQVGNKTSIQITKFDRNIAIDPALFDPPEQDARDFQFNAGNSSENIPFEYYLDHIFMWVNIDGKERLWILDTGAEISCIDSGFAAEIGLTEFGDLTGQGSGSTVSISFVKIPSFSMRGVSFDEQTVGCLDLENAIFKRVGWDCVGILGYDFISRFVIKIDYANKLLSLYDPESFSYEGDGKLLDTPIKGGAPSVPATLDGQYSGFWRLDVGAGGCHLHYPFAEQHKLLAKAGIDKIGFGAGGASANRFLQFKSLEFAGFTINKPLLDFPLKGSSGTVGTMEEMGHLGNSLLRHFTLYFDYNKQQMIVEKGDDFDREFPQDKSGLQVYYDDNNQPAVINVPDNTPAAKAGFKAGDVLLAINDISFENIKGLQALRDFMQAESGTRYKITVKRDEQKLDLNLELRELF